MQFWILGPQAWSGDLKFWVTQSSQSLHMGLRNFRFCRVLFPTDLVLFLPFFKIPCAYRQLVPEVFD